MGNLYSYSRVGSYFTCPSQYAHRYILRTPSPSPEGAELFMGSRFHEAMEFLYGELPRRVPSLKDVLDSFESAWDKSWKELLVKQKQRGFETPMRINREGETAADYHDRAKTFLERYYAKYHPFDADETLAIEKRVLFGLDPAGRYKMQGYIDRVARAKDGTVWIHDYKTGKTKLTPDDARNEDQLALYQIGLASDPMLKHGPFRLAWHFVAFDDDQVESERSEKELDFLRKKYVSKIQTIEKAKDYPTTTSALCGWCDFLSLCPDGQKAVAQRQTKNATKMAAAPKSSKIAPATPPPTPAPEPVERAVEKIEAPVASAPAPKHRKDKKKVSPDQMSLF